MLPGGNERKRVCILFVTSEMFLIPGCRIHDVDSQGLYSNPVQFYDFLQNRVLILFKPKVDDVELPEFELMLSKKMNYDTVRCFIQSLLFPYNFWYRCRRKWVTTSNMTLSNYGSPPHKRTDNPNM